MHTGWENVSDEKGKSEEGGEREKDRKERVSEKEKSESRERGTLIYLKQQKSFLFCPFSCGTSCTLTLKKRK